MPGTDPTDWLHRLDADEWLAAAETELRHGDEAFDRRAVRPAVTHARRAAGMALNAVLTLEPHDRWGRSYMDHLVALADEPLAPDDVRAAARDLRNTPPAPPTLVPLGKTDRHVLASSQRIVAWARARVGALRGAAS